MSFDRKDKLTIVAAIFMIYIVACLTIGAIVGYTKSQDFFQGTEGFIGEKFTIPAPTKCMLEANTIDECYACDKNTQFCPDQEIKCKYNRFYPDGKKLEVKCSDK